MMDYKSIVISFRITNPKELRAEVVNNL